MKFRFTHRKQLSISIERELVEDQRLTYADKGVALILCALPPEQEFSLPEVASKSKGGVQGLKTSMKRLQSMGYLTYHGGVVVIQGHGGREVPKHVEVREKKVQKTKDEYIADRIKEKDKFRALLTETLNTMKPPLPSNETVQEFYRYWTAMDIDPSVPLPYKKARRNTGNFNMLLRLRTWMKRDDKQTEKLKGDRL